ncbi:MAG: peptide chain release factor N(5)-glutamine methyltransferase [Verrucomicrobiota bacterium]|nr:peptide chain release factor N(5)-glutamine methyltransferase [Verrucomicrobiota bacterium]
MSVLEVLRSTAAYFAKRGIENPRLNAEHLLAHSLGMKRLDLYLGFERDLTETELGPLRELVQRRGRREPLQHLLGTVEFCGHTFLCDKRALIPRPETEELVELVGSKIQKPKSKIIDVGTGSGVIALSLAAKFPEAEIAGVDTSDDALTLARENAARLDLERVSFQKSDLLADVDGEFDIIVANLPYVARHEGEQLAPEVRCDPQGALFGGEVGDEIVRRLIEAAPSHLQPGGLLALELGLDQHTTLAALLREKKWRDIETKNDYAGVTRFLSGRYG